MMKVRNITMILITIFIVLTTQKMTRLGVKYNESFCFSEDIPKHVLVKFTASAPVPFLSEIFYGRNIIFKEKQMSPQKQFTTQNLGIYKFCFTNNVNRNPIDISFDVMIGAKANDHGSHDHADQIEQITRMADLAERFIKDIQSQNEEGIEISTKSFRSPIRHNYPLIFSIIFIVITLLISLVQYRIIHRVLLVRKYI